MAKTDRFRDALASILKTVHKQDGSLVPMDKTQDATMLEDLVKNSELLDSLDPD